MHEALDLPIRQSQMEATDMTGYVYFIQPEDDPVVKIGNTINPLADRVLELQTGNHKKLRLIGAIDLQKKAIQKPLIVLSFREKRNCLR
jgi:hypothetical protein